MLPDSAESIVRGSPDGATVLPTAPNAALPAASANALSPTSTVSVSDLAGDLTDLEVRLSRIVSQPPASWQLEPLKREVERLLAKVHSTSDREAVLTTLAKIDRFSAIAQRYQLVGLAANTAPSGPRTTMAAGVVGADGQRYDAVGILRPVVSKRAGAPQFALLNERGQVVSFVTPTPDVNLQPYVGHPIGVTGTRGYIPEFQRTHVTAGRVAPLGERLLR
jgi:hypothetical protein